MGFKHRPRDFWRLVWEGRTVAFAVGLSIYTVSGATVAIFQVPWYAKLIAVFSPPLVAVVAAAWTAFHQILPPLLFDEYSADKKYVCSPCTPSNLREACELVKPIFGANHVDWAILEQWRMRCPQAFMQILNEDGLLTACFVILGLESGFFDQLISGTVAEGDITGQNVLSMREAKKQKRIYISGIFVRKPGSYLGSKRARAMLWSMSKYLVHHFGRKRELFAVALNTPSERLLKTLGFSIVTSAGGRKDHHDFYRLELNKTNCAEIQLRIGDLSPCCTIHYA